MEARAKIALDRLIRALDTEFCKALAEPARVEILKVLLVQGPSDVSAVAKHLSQDRSVVSRHLKTLLHAGLVRREKHGRNRIYTLDGPYLFRRFDELARSVRNAIELCCPPGTIVPSSSTVQIH
jgi:DNA-binding transcriptional ArsR family regulator